MDDEHINLNNFCMKFYCGRRVLKTFYYLLQICSWNDILNNTFCIFQRLTTILQWSFFKFCNRISLFKDKHRNLWPRAWIAWILCNFQAPVLMIFIRRTRSISKFNWLSSKFKRFLYQFSWWFLKKLLQFHIFVCGTTFLFQWQVLLF